MNTETKIATINGVDIVVLGDGNKLVPIRPICEALGIDRKSQQDKINEDEILSSIGVLSTLVAADGKEREMFCLPLKFIFGWLFTINPKNVAPDAAEAVRKYKLACYEVLFEHFSEQGEFLEWRQQHLNKHLTIVSAARAEFATAKKRLYEENEALNSMMKVSFSQWKSEKNQLQLSF